MAQYLLILITPTLLLYGGTYESKGSVIIDDAGGDLRLCAGFPDTSRL
jgi:hypothetical protein